MPTITEETPFEYQSKFGTIFKADRNDFNCAIKVTLPKNASKEKIIADSIEMAAWHALNVRSQINGCAGYAGLEFVIKQ